MSNAETTENQENSNVKYSFFFLEQNHCKNIVQWKKLFGKKKQTRK